MTRRDQGIVGALVATFAAIAIVIALPAAIPARSSGASSPPGTLPAPVAAGSGATANGSAAPGQASSSDGSPSATSAPTGSDVPPPGVIRQGVVGQPTSINPLTARSQPDRDLVALVFSGLVRLGPKDTLLPDLADRWSADATGVHWTFHIRSTATWQDGKPVTADDVVFTIKLLRDPAYTGPFRGSWNEITVKKLDALTVRFDLKTALGDFLQLARQPLLPSHLLKSVPIQGLVDSAFSSAPVGSGPYRLLQWDATSALLQLASVTTAPEATPTAGSAGPLGSAGASGSPAPTATSTPTAAPPSTPTQIELRFYATAAGLAQAYRNGEVDIADGLPADLATQLDALPGTRVIRDPRATLTAVLLNLRTNHPTIRDQSVRQALLKVIDRVALVNEVMGGFGNRADSLIPPTSWAFVKTAATPVEYSTANAAKELQAAGWRKVTGHWHPPGSKNIFTIELITTTKATNPVTWNTAQYVARAWRSFGITVRVVALAPNVLVGERLSQANFTAAVVDMNIGLDPDLYPLLASRQAGIGGSNLTGVQSLVLDDLLIKARQPGTLAQRRGAWAKLESFLATAQVTLPLAFRDDALVVSNRVSGPRPHLLGDLSDRFWDVLTWRLASGG